VNPILLVIACVAIGVALARRLRASASLRDHAMSHGWAFQERDDELATTFTLPPFVDLPAPATPSIPPELRSVRVRDVARFAVARSQALAFTVDDVVGADETLTTTYQVVALHTRQHLPRTMMRAGIDVYVLPSYDGMPRLREPRRRTRGGVLSIISAEPARAASLPFDALVRDLGLDHQLTIAADGDWMYAYRPAVPAPWRIEAMLTTLQKLARGIASPRWPSEEAPPSYVYGAI
jgi:hypothetical protein